MNSRNTPQHVAMTVDEELLSLSELGRKLPSPRGYVTVYNWATSGVKGVDGETHMLETVRIAGVLHSSLPAFYRWLEKTNAK